MRYNHTNTLEAIKHSRFFKHYSQVCLKFKTLHNHADGCITEQSLQQTDTSFYITQTATNSSSKNRY